jgi:hypothetical protein
VEPFLMSPGLARLLFGLAVFVVALFLLAMLVGGIAYLAGFGLGVVEVLILAAVAAFVTWIVVRRRAVA